MRYANNNTSLNMVEQGLFTNTSSLTTDPPSGWETYLDYYQTFPITVVKITALLLFVVGFLANSLLLYYLIRSGKFRLPTFLIITSFAIGDWLTCIAAICWLVVFYPTMPYPSTSFICTIAMYLIRTVYYITTYHLAYFAIMRYYMLVYPLTAMANVTSKFVLKCCLAIWIIGLSVGIPFIPLSKSQDISYRGKHIVVCEFYGDYRLKDILLDYVGYLIPLVIVTSFHIVKHIQLTRSKNTEMTSQREQRQNTNVKAIMAVIFFLFATNFPSFVHTTLHEIARVPYESFHYPLYTILTFFALLNNIVNPFIYGFMSSAMRKDIWKMMKRDKSDNQINP